MRWRWRRRSRFAGGRFRRAVGKPGGPPARVAQQGNLGGAKAARGRSRGIDPQGRRGSLRRGFDRDAAVPRTHFAARPRRRVRVAADQERRRHRRRDGGGHRGARRRPDHAGRGASHRQGARFLCKPTKPATSTNACRCSKPGRPKTGRPSRGLGRFRALQLEEELRCRPAAAAAGCHTTINREWRRPEPENAMPKCQPACAPRDCRERCPQ